MLTFIPREKVELIKTENELVDGNAKAKESKIEKAESCVEKI